MVNSKIINVKEEIIPKNSILIKIIIFIFLCNRAAYGTFFARIDIERI